MRLALYIVLSFVVTVAAVLLLTRGPAPESHPAVLFALVVLFSIAPLGAFWMIYMSIRYEKRPLALVLLAFFVPFTFVWYYFERVRTGKLQRIRNSN
jgi:hypothetical protein